MLKIWNWCPFNEELEVNLLSSAVLLRNIARPFVWCVKGRHSATLRRDLLGFTENGRVFILFHDQINRDAQLTEAQLTKFDLYPHSRGSYFMFNWRQNLSGFFCSVNELKEPLITVGSQNSESQNSESQNSESQNSESQNSESKTLCKPFNKIL